MELSDITVMEVGRENYLRAAESWRIHPRNEKERIIWSVIKNTLIYPDFRTLVEDFLRTDYADMIFVRGKEEAHLKQSVRKIDSSAIIDRIVELAQENEHKRGFLEFKFLNPEYFGQHKRQVVLSFIEENGMIVLGGLSVPREYAHWLHTTNKTEYYRFNDAVLSTNCTFRHFKKK